MRATSCWLCVVALLLCALLSQGEGAPVKRQTNRWWDRYQNALQKIKSVIEGVLRGGNCLVGGLATPCPPGQALDTLGRCRAINQLILEFQTSLKSQQGRNNEIETI